MIDDTVDAAEIPQNHLECIKKNLFVFIMVDFNYLPASTGFLKRIPILSWIRGAPQGPRPRLAPLVQRAHGPTWSPWAWWPFERMWRMVRPKNFLEIFFQWINSLCLYWLYLIHGLSLCNHTIFSHVSKTSMKFKPLETGNFEQLRRSQDLQLLQLLTEFLPSCCRLPP